MRAASERSAAAQRITRLPRLTGPLGLCDRGRVTGGPSDRSAKLCVGIALNNDPASSRRLLADFCRALAQATGMQVVPRSEWHYHRLLEGVDAGEVDIVWLPPILALQATARGRVVPIALPVRNGACWYSTALFARAGSRVTTVADLVGVRAAWVDRQSAAGYLIVRAHLRTLGVDLEHAFAADQFLGAHDAVARAVLEGEADVGATYVYMSPDSPGTVKSAGWGAARVQIVAHAGPIPADVVAVGARLPGVVAARVQHALLADRAELARTARALLEAEGFVLPRPEHLEPLLRLLGSIEDHAAPHSLYPRS